MRFNIQLCDLGRYTRIIIRELSWMRDANINSTRRHRSLSTLVHLMAILILGLSKRCEKHNQSVRTVGHAESPHRFHQSFPSCHCEETPHGFSCFKVIRFAWLRPQQSISTRQEHHREAYTIQPAKSSIISAPILRVFSVGNSPEGCRNH